MNATLATQSAKAGQANEDYAGMTGNVFVVTDGAGTPAGSDSGCIHGVAWYSHNLGSALLHRAAVTPATLSEALAASISDVADLHRDTCDLDHPGTPSATVTAVRLNGSQFEYLALADSPLVIRRRDGVQVITDDREAIVGRRYRQHMDATAAGTPEHVQAHREYVETMRAHRNRPDGFWVASNDPKAAHQAMTGTIDVFDVQDLALLSDGASRLVDRFDLASWDTALDMVRNDGPDALIRAVRRAEASDSEGRRWPRGKSSDDATVVHVRLA